MDNFRIFKGLNKIFITNQNILRLLNTQKTVIIDNPIKIRAITHDHPLAPNHPNCTFIPKKLAIRVGGIKRSETSVNTFMILF